MCVCVCVCVSVFARTHVCVGWEETQRQFGKGARL